VAENEEMPEDELEALDEADEATSGHGVQGFLVGLMVGTMVGMSLALLFAPAKGQTTRRRLKRRIGKLRDRAEHGAQDFAKRARRELTRLER
jgi:gas vesicle protein